MQRPQPPESLFNDEYERFRPATDVVDWIRSTFLDTASPLYNPEHDHLRDARIGALWTTIENERHMNRIAAQAEIPAIQGGRWVKARSEQQLGAWFGELPNFILTFDAGFCATLSDVDWCALVEHELFHCAQSKDKYGAPRFDKFGSPVYSMRGHDVEEFVGVVARYGVGQDSALRRLVDAANQTPLVAQIDVKKACGSCA